MNYINLVINKEDNNIEPIDGKTGALISAAIACEIMEMVIKSSLNKYYGMSDAQFMKFSDELAKLKTSLVGSINSSKDYSLHFLKDSAYLCKRIHKIGLLLKGNSNSTFNQDLLIAIQLSELSLNSLISFLKNQLMLDYNEQMRKELEPHIDILTKEDIFYQKLMESPDY